MIMRLSSRQNSKSPRNDALVFWNRCESTADDDDRWSDMVGIESMHLSSGF